MSLKVLHILLNSPDNFTQLSLQYVLCIIFASEIDFEDNANFLKSTDCTGFVEEMHKGADV